MKLGIVVVYLVSPENEKLLELHLKQIEKHTSVPYTIYGSVNRLLPEFRQKLAKHPAVKICACPETDLLGPAEHAYYLEELTKYAIEDGSTHIVTMHVDSFPIRDRWAEELAEKVSDPCVFATIDNINTACLFFSRNFYLQYQPKYALTREEHSCPEYWRYQHHFNPNTHSGIGYGFRVYSEGLSWYYLRESAGSSDKCCIYDDMIFHLIGAISVGGQQFQTFKLLKKPSFIYISGKIIQWAKMFTPVRTREKLRKVFGGPIEFFLDRPRILAAKGKLLSSTQELLNNPELYISSLRSNRN